MDSEIVNFTIDGMPVSAPKGTTVYTMIKKLGIKVPIFCYQDRMPPFGACRVCLVEVEKMGKLQASCTLVATEGMVIRTQSELAVKGREDILELLLINHPLDCPICDRGGECPLQDQVVEHGPGKSRFYEEKRHFTKPLPLGPVLMLDRERCIVCARCTRFSEHISGDHALEMHDRGYKTEVGTPHKGPVDSKFIGNTIMICPVGALTSNVYRFRARPWDNLPTESTCTFCPVGCSMILDNRDGEIVRTRSLENRAVNDIWLCDKGWFGYEFVTHPERLTQPLIKRAGHLQPATWQEAMDLIVEKICEIKGKGKAAAFGGNPLTTEENYLFQKLMRDVIGSNHIDHRMNPLFDEEARGMEISFKDVESLSYIIILGADLTEEVPLLWLRVKQAMNKGARVYFLGHYAPEVATQLEDAILHPPGKEMEAIDKFVNELIDQNKGSKGALFVGRQYLGTPHQHSLIAKLNDLQQKTQNLSLNFLSGSGNSRGAYLAGMRPDSGPLYQALNEKGLGTQEVLEQAAQEGWDFLYVAGANPVKKTPSSLWQAARSKLGFLIVQDLFLTETALQADVVLPTSCFLEKEGSFINLENRVQKLKPGKLPPEGLFSDGEIFSLIAEYLNVSLKIDEPFSQALNEKFIKSIQEPVGRDEELSSLQEGECFVTLAPKLFDQGVRMKHDKHLSRLAKDPKVSMSMETAAKFDAKNGDFVRICHQGNSIVGELRIDSQVADETVVLPEGFDQLPIYELGNLFNGSKVTIKKEYQHKFSHAL